MGVIALALLLPHAASAQNFLRTLFDMAHADTPAASNIFVHDTRAGLLEAAVHSDPNKAKGGAEVTVVDESALIAEGSVGGEDARTLTSSNGGQISLYVVREGDSLSQIAEMFDVSVNTIIWANNLKNAQDINPDDTLVILPVSGLRYAVEEGDTLKSIAKEYKGDAEEIALFNGLSVGDTLAVGAEIIIPGGEMSVPEKSRVIASTAVRNVAGYFINPVPGSVRTQGLHGYNAVDLGARPGSSVVAAASGSVIVSREGGWNGGYGNYIVIRHENGTQTLYAHNSDNIVGVGSWVAQGQVIGYVGSTGRSTGPHVHFEVRGATNPFAY